MVSQITYQFGGPVTLYAVGGNAIKVGAFSVDTSGFGVVDCSFSGHLVTP